jgi:nicotinamide-nucleotide amidase
LAAVSSPLPWTIYPLILHSPFSIFNSPLFDIRGSLFVIFFAVVGALYLPFFNLQSLFFNQLIILAIFKPNLYLMPSQLVLDCGHLLMEKKLTVAFAESATAGRAASEFSMVPDSGKFLIGGLVCYDACVKQEILGVPEEMIKKFTPESEQVTEEMAKRLPRLIRSDIQVAITGLTTPGGSETPEKPVGSMFIHLFIKGKSVRKRRNFSGDPEQVVLQTVDTVAELILDALRFDES